MNIFDYKSYQKYLVERAQKDSARVGYKTRLAKAAKVHPSFMSRVIAGHVHLTQDQALLLSRYFRFTNDETEYFLLLVAKERASEPQYIEFLQMKMRKLSESQESELGTSLSAKKVDHSIDRYYSSWIYSATHMALTLKGASTTKEIATRLRIPDVSALDYLRGLQEMGLAKTTGHSWSVTEKNIHVSNGNWLSNVHHANWRLKCAERLGSNTSKDYHYTGVHSLSEQDFLDIKESFKRNLIGVDRVVRASKEETVAVFCVDLFEV